MGDYSFDVLELLSELKFHKQNARPLKLICRSLDMPRRKVVALIKKAREEIADDGVLIMDNGSGSFYLKGSFWNNEENNILP